MYNKPKKSKKVKCSCNPKGGGCSHFGSGRCRIMNGQGDCIMSTNSYHFKCCPILQTIPRLVEEGRIQLSKKLLQKTLLT